MVHAQWNNTCAKHILCVDSYENRVLKGRLYKSGQEMEEISSLGDFLVTMESIVDGESHPAGIEKLPVLRKGKRMTFELQILFHQHNSWQGKLKWLEKNAENSFRSALELFLLIDGAMQTKIA